MRSVVVLALIAAALQVSDFAQHKAPVKVTITTPTPISKSGTPIRIDLSVSNVSDKAVKLLKTLGFDGQAEFVNHVEVYDADGKPLARLAGRHSSISRKTIIVEPGKSLDDFMILSNLFDLTKAGTYKVSVRHELIQLDATEPENRRLFVPSNTLEIRVVD